MRNSKLFRHFNTLSPSDFKQFERFMHSPFFGSHRDTLRLFEDLANYYPDLDRPELDRVSVYARLFPDKPYDDGHLRTLRKYLLQQLYRFFIQAELADSVLMQQSLKLQALAKRDLDADFMSNLNKERRQLKAFPYRNADYFLGQFQLENSALVFGYTTSRWAQKDQEVLIHALDHFYLAEKLRFCCSIMNVRNVFSKEGEIPLLDEILKYCKSQEHKLPSIVTAYYHLLSLSTAEEPKVHYEALRHLAHETFDQFPPDDWVNIYSALINHCNHLYRTGELNYLREMFDLYQEMLERNLLLEGGKLATNNYKNITTLGLRLGEYRWTETFIQDYKEKIDPEFQEGVYNYNMAHFYAYQAKYSQALKHLQQIDFIDPFYRMSYNMLLLKIYYECNEIEALLALCESFRAFVRHKQALSKTHQLAYINFAKFTRALFRLKIGIDKKPEKLKVKIENCEVLIERQWILEKLESIQAAT